MLVQHILCWSYYITLSILFYKYISKYISIFIIILVLIIYLFNIFII